jgi:hypothetical protein
MKKLLSLFALTLLISVHAFAQQIREQDIVYSRYIVREIDLRASSNKVIFGKDCILPSILLDAVKDGAKAYSFENRTKQIAYEEILEKLILPSSDDSCGFTRYLPQELYVLELTEKFIFDKNTSEFKLLPIELTLFIPAEISSKGIQEPLAVIPFEECTRIFRNDARAYSAVTKIGQPRINFNEQFLLRSYTSNIVKIGNEDDLYFDQQYSDPYIAFMAMKQEEQALQEMMYQAYHPK